jgi:Glycosyl transferase family 11
MKFEILSVLSSLGVWKITLYHEDTMIIVRLDGGLGNQMFQYAVGRAAAIRHGTRLRFDLQTIAADTKRAYCLAAWRIAGTPASRMDMLRMRVLNKVSRKLHPSAPYYRHPVIVERNCSFDNNLLEAKRDCWLFGYWQSEKYFDAVAGQIRADFTPACEISITSRAVEREILASGNRSVFLHIRRGDYVSDPQTLQIHGSCSIEYYLRAADLIAQQVPDPRFFIFSDGPEWVRDNLHLPYHTTIVGHNKPSDAFRVGSEHEDLWLMSRCRHAVLANSSFSWWGAWLNPVMDRIVIAPKKWLRMHDDPDRVPERWIRI